MSAKTKKAGQGLALCNQYQLSSRALTDQFNQRLDPELSYLIAQPWFRGLYKTIIPQLQRETKIENMTTHTNPKVLNILEYLLQYLTTKTEQANGNRAVELIKLLTRLSSRGFRQLTRVDRYHLRRLLEIDAEGSKLKQEFFEYLRQQPDLITQDSELLLNPFTSIINLAEIYRQVQSHTIVNWSCGRVVDGLPDALEFYSDTPNGPDQSEVLEYCQRLALFNLFIKSRNLPKRVSIYLIDYKKEFMQVKSRPDLIFTSSEINTGVCDGVSIIISRREESLKTLIHELVHFHDLDFKHEVPRLDAVVQQVTANNVSTSQTSTSGDAKFNLGEAHTECLASIIHLLIRSTESAGEESIVRRHFAELFKKQVIYTLAKQAAIMRTSHCSDLSVNSPQCHIRESTNLFSYFFVKSYLYFNLRAWLEGCCAKDLPKFRHNQHSAFTNLSQILKTGSTDHLIKALVRDLGANSTNGKHTQRAQAKSQNGNGNSLRMVCAD
jgi:hypothetical protein